MYLLQIISQTDVKAVKTAQDPPLSGSTGFNEQKCVCVMQAAHEQLVGSSQQLRALGKSSPSDLLRSLMLLHSYILVKTLIRMADHQVPSLLLWG